ncbi:porphobilinogen deaminase [Nadsonia fulvescens var. elongata DSM 6958]|uniref:Porphobilinogen deaminase n=1 Tax=Nadsonia fulvescens var. elongata DSM 6958 TaxID=857566 RepID=A0A1E3PQK8_9ASCO|nr:porphobilinogen deaminase [Nadsonia fulvescens var. elongata DSM 6958]
MERLIAESTIRPFSPSEIDTKEASLEPIHIDSGVQDRPRVHVGGRKSKLAVVQTKIVAAELQKVHPDLSFPVLAISTLGDQVQGRPLYAFGGKALWTKELETLLLEENPTHEDEHLDMIVHSLKDMPTSLPEGCILGAILKREDPRDALVMKAGSPHKLLRDLPPNAIVGTSSIRRSAQLKKNYPHLQFESVRGNVITRLAKLDATESPYACLILAVAGLVRLGLGYRITSHLQAPDMYHAVGQGALGIECRANDQHTLDILKPITDKTATITCLAERALMRTLEGGCSVPIGVESAYNLETKVLFLEGVVISVDGQTHVQQKIERVVESEEEADSVGRDLAQLLIKCGAKDILDEIHQDMK